MKTSLVDSQGKKKGDIELPSLFSTPIREDLVAKYFEISRYQHPYGPNPEAGKRHSASGTISHQRHDWKGHYGKGISRVPRKTMYRHGTQFFWIAAEVSGTRGGRRAHPPKPLLTNRKMNKKESRLAMNIALAATANKAYVQSRYSSLEKIDSAPLVLESLPTKTKEIIATMKNIFGNNFNIAIKRKTIRAGKGKSRGRRYKSNAGVLLVVSSTEKPRFKGLDMKTVQQLSVTDFYPLGRLTVYTKKALEELEAKK
ncbi:MAG: 50S ribosomal protein L4 [Nanoarchaeota archaeon]|nr:50S ribosomal protein L4 [Nanoarchaeota archaeon]